MTMEELSETMHTLFGKSLMQVDCNEMDAVTKQVLKLSSVDTEREKCNQIGLLNDLCVWLTQCYRFFSNVSTSVQFSENAETPVNVTVSMSILSVATNLTRILRNMCSDNRENQSLVLTHGIPHSVIPLIRDKHLWGAGEMDWSEWFETFVHISLQLLFNVLTNNADAKQSLWAEYYPDCYKFLLKHYSHNTKIASFSLAVLYNFFANADSSPDASARLSQFVEDREAVTLLFARSMSTDYTNTSSEWITYTTRVLLATAAQAKTPQLVEDTLAALQTASFPIVSPAQLLFLFYCLEVCDDNSVMSQPVARFLLRSCTLEADCL